MNAQEPVRLHVSPLAYLAAIFAGALLVTMVALLITQLTVLTDQRKLLESQEAKITRLENETTPLLREVEPAIRDAEPLVRRARALIRPAGESLEAVTIAAEALPRVMRGIDTLLVDAIPLVRSLGAGDRMVRLIDTAQHALPRVEGLLAETLHVQRRTLRIQRRTLRVQLASFHAQIRNLRMFSESLAIQRETLEHTRSIDRKTGPAPPATPVTLTP